MKAVFVSDSHGRYGGLQEIIEREAPFDVLLHAGDIQGGIGNLEDWAGCPVYVVKGNCDWYGDYPQECIVPFGRDRIFLTHGHRYGVKLGRQELAAAADRLGAKIAVYGHTHIPLVEERYGGMTLGPGSVSEPRQENRRPTYGVLERTAEKGLFWEIKYL